MKGIWIGTSGWSYKEWAKSFYPSGHKDELGYYVTQFPTVEINATFYRLPTKPMVQNWNTKAPQDFIFAVKGSRYITHMKKLTGVALGLKRYFARLVPLRPHTGPILWQLPPFMKKDLPRLEKFLTRLPREYRYAVEFRHPSWMDAESFDLLREHNTACVWISSRAMPMDFTVTADFVYMRFHGLEGGPSHDYTDDELKPWAEQFLKVAQQNKDAFVYFNNDQTTRAIFNARTLFEMTKPYAVKLSTVERL